MKNSLKNPKNNKATIISDSIQRLHRQFKTILRGFSTFSELQWSIYYDYFIVQMKIIERSSPKVKF